MPGGSGFADAALLAGRPFSSYLHIGALLAAAGADVGAFYQIVALALDAPEPIIYLVVIGFTATVVYLAHVVGLIFRNKKAGVRSTSPIAAWLCIPVLVGLGTVGFLVRLLSPIEITSDGPPDFTADPSTSLAPPDENQQLITAVVFLALFVATVMVAAVGAYLTHNPLREGYAAAVRAHRRWTTETAVAQAAFIVAQSHATSEDTNRRTADKILEMQTQTRLALAQELKHKARIRLLSAAKDAAVTDAYSEDDKRPYTHPKHGPRTNGSG